MKTLFLTTALGVVCVSAFGQGTVLFSNHGPNFVGGPQPNAPVYEADGVTKCAGPQFTAELFAGPNSNSLAAIAMTGFGTGAQAGYFSGGTQTINSVPAGGWAWIQVDVWNTASGASFAQAQASGLPNSWWQSYLLNYQIGLNNPLIGLGTSPVYLNSVSVPEPSALALASLGLAALLLLRRRPQVGLNNPTTTNPAITSRCYAEDQRRRFVDWNRYPPSVSAGVSK
jgi:hypothetical protein